MPGLSRSKKALIYLGAFFFYIKERLGKGFRTLFTRCDGSD